MTNFNTRYFMIATLFVAIVFLQVFVPWLGLLPLGAFIVGASVTIIQFTVAIAGIVLGPKYGAVVGCWWGVLSFVNAWTHQGTIGSLMFQNPLTAIIPRVLVGLIVGYVFNKIFRNQSTAIRLTGLGISGILAALINTIGVVLLTWLGFTIMRTNFTGVPLHNILVWLIGIVSFNAIFEIIVGFVLVGLIGSVLLPIAERANIRG